MRILSLLALTFLFWLPSPASDAPHACFTVVAGIRATQDGSVLVAHNEDDPGNLHVNVFKVPASARRHSETGTLSADSARSRVAGGFLWLEVPGQEFADSYASESGLVIASNACRSREDREDVTGGGIGYMLGRLLIERARTAHEAVKLAGALIEQYGYSSSGRNYVIADTQEGWFFHAVRGRHWVAQRVPDGDVALISNYYRIGRVNLRDTQHFKASPGLVEYAIKRGWYHPERDGEFDFARAYSDPDNLRAPENVLRQWRGTVLLGNRSLRPGDPLPFSFEPRRQLRPTDLFHLLRDHYEGTDLDLTDGYRKGSPHSTGNRTICTRSTQYSFVAHLRANLPIEIGPLLWLSFRHPCLHAFTPWYPTIDHPAAGFAAGEAETALASHLKPGAIPPAAGNAQWAFTAFNRVSEVVAPRYGEQFKAAAKVGRNLESFALKELPRKEKEFAYLLGVDREVARHLITHYVHGQAYQNWFLALDLLRELRGGAGR